MKKILIGMPTSSHVHYEFTSSLFHLAFKAYKHYNHKLAIETMFVEGVRTDRNRNQIVERFMQGGFDYLLFLDTDMVYPPDTLIKYIESGKDLIGGVYFKRSTPHFPVVYRKQEAGKFVPIDPLSYGYNQLVEVDGLGTGGMLISRNVFEAIEAQGKEYWFKYSDNYHLHNTGERQATHDLVFCEIAQSAGIQPYLHTGVRMGHISSHVVTHTNWITDREDSEANDQGVQIIMPAYGVDNYDTLMKAITSIEAETNYEKWELLVHVDGDQKLEGKILANKMPEEFAHTTIVSEESNVGFANVVNGVIKESKYNFFVFVGQDIIAGENWLGYAMEDYRSLFPDLDGLLKLNDGRRHDAAASAPHCLVHRNFMRRYTGDNLFYPEYSHYYSDQELRDVAKAAGRFGYSPSALLYHEQAKAGRAKSNSSLRKGMGTATADGELYARRKTLGFPMHFGEATSVQSDN